MKTDTITNLVNTYLMQFRPKKKFTQRSDECKFIQIASNEHLLLLNLCGTALKY